MKKFTFFEYKSKTIIYTKQDFAGFFLKNEDF
jgi:hypothetical protein